MQNITDAGAFADYPPHLVLQAVLATNLTSFTEFAFGVVRPGVTFKPNWHFEAVTHKLSEVASGEVRRLIITLPPRNLKSLCASVALPAWFLGRNPSERVVVVSAPAQKVLRAKSSFKRNGGRVPLRGRTELAATPSSKSRQGIKTRVMNSPQLERALSALFLLGRTCGVPI